MAETKFELKSVFQSHLLLSGVEIGVSLENLTLEECSVELDPHKASSDNILGSVLCMYPRVWVHKYYFKCQTRAQQCVVV